MAGLFGNMFDMNHDGKMSGFERAMEFHFMEEMLRNEHTGGSSEYEDDDDEVLTELELAGIDPEELEFMDDDERCEVLEEAGLDPDDYDF